METTTLQPVISCACQFISLPTATDEEACLLPRIQSLLQEGTALSEILVVCPDAGVAQLWSERLRLHQLPVWGQPDAQLEQDMLLFRHLLRWRLQVSALEGQPFEQAYTHPDSLDTMMQILRLEGIPYSSVKAPYAQLREDDQVASLLSRLERLYLLPAEDGLGWLQQALAHHLFGNRADAFNAMMRQFAATVETQGLSQFIPLEEVLHQFEPFKANFAVNPYPEGIRVGSIDAADGIDATHVLIPQLHKLFKHLQPESAFAQLKMLVTQAESVMATVTASESVWWEEAQARQWLVENNWQEVAWKPAQRSLPAWLNTASPWLDYQPVEARPVLDDGQTLALSPSSIETYLTCPRRFFYQTLLQLYDDASSPQATVGILIHRILEVFNRNYATAGYTLENLIALTNSLFAENEMGSFVQKDLNLLAGFSPLQRQQIHSHILASFQDMAAKGYFEIRFEQLHIETELEIPLPSSRLNLSLKGRADLIREKPDDTVEIVDYKTTKAKYTSVGYDYNIKPLQQALEALDWDEPDPHARYGRREYQLPLYWLMAQNLPSFEGKRTHVTLQTVRPSGPGGTVNGAISLTLQHVDLQQGAENLRLLLEKGLVEPLEACSGFAALGKREFNCGGCSYNTICEGPAQGEEGDE